MRRFILGREEGGYYELMSRAQLEAELDAMATPPNCIGVIWFERVVAYLDYWSEADCPAARLKRILVPRGVVFDFLLWRKYPGVGPWRWFPVRHGRSTDLRGKVKRRAQDAALQALVARACRRFGQ
jgi:hypothetical protein